MRRSGKTGKGFVYFMRRADGVGPIKIGCSKKPLNRLEAHQHWSPEPLSIVAYVEGTFADEQRLHRQFNAFRLHGEWFEASPPVLAMMNRAHTTGELSPAPASDRTLQIAAQYRGGATLQEIGDNFGITRERVRQILRKSGVPSEGFRPEVMRSSVASKNEKQVIAMARDGHSVPEIAEAIGDCQTNVRVVLKRCGVTARNAKRKHEPETIALADRVAADYNAGLSNAEIAERNGLKHLPDIYRLLRIAGVTPNNRSGRLSAAQRREIVAAYKQGLTIEEVAEKFGCGSQTARRHIIAANALRSKAESEAIRVARVVAANKKRWAA